MIRYKEKLPKKLINKKKNIRKKVKNENEAKMKNEDEEKKENGDKEEIEIKLNRLVEITAKLFELGVEGIK